MPLYEIWESADGSELTLLPADSPQHGFLTRSVDEEQMILVASFYSSSWGQAVKDRNAIMDW